MARKPRREFPDGVYHTTARGTGRIDIVRDAIDCEAFIKFLSLVVQRWNWQIAAYCLMTNHYHVVLEATVQDLSKGMHALNGRHARRFNERHERDGHLFQERFDARLIETEEHLAAACEYVLDNPVRAGLCRERRDWPWSSAATSPW